jgi:hypothetical protein
MTKKTDHVTVAHLDRSTPKHVSAREVISEVFNHILDDDADLCFSARNMPTDIDYASTIRLRDSDTFAFWRLFRPPCTMCLDRSRIVYYRKSSIDEIRQHTIRHNQPTLTSSSYKSLSWNAINLQRMRAQWLSYL